MATRDQISGLLIIGAVVALAVAAWMPPAALHPVTTAMTDNARAMSGRRVTTQSAIGSDGRTHAPQDEARGRPVVLVFIRDGCPCSESAEPYFQRLQAAYGERASFLGVIDGDLAMAREWATRHGTSYPILADFERVIIGDCGAERSAYVMLVAPGGTVEAVWPGYSSEMLAEVGARLARITGQAEVALDAEGAPAELVSGCPF
jgi:peroxiredoxin